MPLPTPDELVGWAPPQVINGTTSQVVNDWASQSDAYRSQVSQDQWDPIVQQVQAAVDGTGPPIQIGSHTVGPGATPEQQADAVRILAYRSGNPVQNWSTSDILGKLASGGAKALGAAGLIAGGMSLFGGAGGAAAGGAAAGGPILDSSGAEIPGTEVAAGAGGLGSQIGNFLTKYGDYIIPGVNTLLGAHAANESSDAMARAAEQAIAEEQRQFDLTRADWQPWMDLGKGAITNLSDPAKNFLASPNYDWVKSEGMRDVGNTFSARGMGQSGNALKALTEFNQNLASNEFMNWTNTELAKAGLGTTGTGQVTNARQNATNATGNYLMDRGNARASGILGRNAAVAGGVNDAYYNYLYRRGGA